MAQPFENFAFVGRDAVVAVSLTASQTPPSDYEDLAAVRGLDFGTEWETVDTTARGTSSGDSRTSLVTYSNNNVDIDGLVIVNAARQQALRRHIRNPPQANNRQPNGWVRITEPLDGSQVRIEHVPALFTSFRVSAAYDGEATFTLAIESQGDPVEVIV